MKRLYTILRSFRVKVGLIVILAMLFSAALSNYLIYEYSFRSQFNQLRDNLMIIAEVAAMVVDPDTLLKVPLDRAGAESTAYKAVAERLARIKRNIPEIYYIYTLAKTGRPGIYRFIVDPEPGAVGAGRATSYPGDIYDGSKLPEMEKGFTKPSADTAMGIDPWGMVLSGYAPIVDRNGNAIAVLGIDMDASEVYEIEMEVRRRAIFVLVLGLGLAVILGIWVSGRVTDPVSKLITATRHIAKGNLQYKVEVKGDDEVAELSEAFNKMSSDLRTYLEELKRTTAEKERLLKELEIAKKIQQSFLPASMPVIKGFEITAATTPARIVGGDFYDFVPEQDGRWGVLVADVSGKGMAAALFMALSKTVLHASIMGKSSMHEAIEQANRLIVEDNRTNLFVTLFYAVLDPKGMSLRYSNAGHNPPLLFREGAGEPVLLTAQEMPLGLIKDLQVSSEEIALKKGDVIAVYSDGVTEAINNQGEQFDITRLSAVISENRHSAAGEIAAKTHEALENFVGREPQFDDITLMIIKAL